MYIYIYHYIFVCVIVCVRLCLPLADLAERERETLDGVQLRYVTTRTRNVPGCFSIQNLCSCGKGWAFAISHPS